MCDIPEQDRLRRLVELGPSLVSELDLDTLLDRLLEAAREVTDAGYAAIGTFDSEGREFERSASDSSGSPPVQPPLSGLLVVPILIRGHAWGNLYLANNRGGEFDADDQQAAVTLAAWAAIAVEHARLLDAARTREDALERAVRGLEATQAIAVAVGVENDLSRVLELIATRGRAIVDARSVVILLKDNDDLVVGAGAGYGQPQLGARIPIAESTSGEVMVTQRPSRIGNVDSQLRVSPQTLGILEAHSALLMPLVYRGRALGVLAAFDRGQGTMTFTEGDEQVLVAFAASAATAVATAQAVEADRLRHSIDAAEAERKHWARELHDETLQALGGLKVLASAARRETELTVMTAALDQVVAGLESQIESVHAIISELRPAALDDLGLLPAIEALAQRHRVVHGAEVGCQLEIPDPTEATQRLAPEVETTVYRLVQEALTNVIKHANASRVHVGVAASAREVSIEVSDDGDGFDSSTSDAGFGLTGMRERIALAGGTITIGSDRGGTTVRASLPARYIGATSNAVAGP